MIIPLVISYFLAVLLESSLLPLPFLLWVTWYWSNKLEMGKLVWFAVGSGVLLDILVVRNLGITAVLLWIFLLMLVIVRQWFPTETVAERGGVILAALSWSYFLGGMSGLFFLGAVLILTMLLMLLKEERKWGIRLK